MNIYTFEKVQPKKSIFLAGPTYRIEDGATPPRSWRDDAIENLRKRGFDGNILKPSFILVSRFIELQNSIRSWWLNSFIAFRINLPFFPKDSINFSSLSVFPRLHLPPPVDFSFKDGFASFSNITTLLFFLAAWMAAKSPAGPEPTIKRSYLILFTFSFFI